MNTETSYHVGVSKTQHILGGFNIKKNLTKIVFILDRSGSMAGLEHVAIGGFNAMIEKQKEKPVESVISTVLFVHESVVIHDRADVRRNLICLVTANYPALGVYHSHGKRISFQKYPLL